MHEANRGMRSDLKASRYQPLKLDHHLESPRRQYVINPFPELSSGKLDAYWWIWTPDLFDATLRDPKRAEGNHSMPAREVDDWYKLSMPKIDAHHSIKGRSPTTPVLISWEEQALKKRADHLNGKKGFFLFCTFLVIFF